MSAHIGTPEQAHRIITTIEARAKQLYPDVPISEGLKLLFEHATDAEASYKRAQEYLSEHEAEATRKRLRSESRDEFYRSGAGAALYEQHVRQTSVGEKRLLQHEVEKLFDDVACAGLCAFVKRLTGGGDVAALNVVYGNAPQIYEERHAAIRAAVAGRPEAEVLEYVAKSMDLAKRIAHIADAVVKGAATTDPGRAIREGASR